MSESREPQLRGQKWHDGEEYGPCDLYTIAFNSFMRGMSFRAKVAAPPTDDEAIEAAEKYIAAWLPDHKHDDPDTDGR